MSTTTPKEWRKKREPGIEITLPEYGDNVFIRPMDAELFFKSGKLPDFLAKTVRDMLGAPTYTMPSPPSDDDEQTREWVKWLDDLVKYAFVSPKVVDTPRSDDEIGVDEIGYTDKLHIYYLFGRPAQVLRKFRRDTQQPLEPVDDAKADGDTPVESDASEATRGANLGDA